MFEKEAEEYKDTYFGFADERISEVQDFEGNYIDISERIMKTFIDGAEFGYNKANEWHYPSKGEYPKGKKKVLCVLGDFENDNLEVGYYSQVEGDSKRWRFHDYDLPDDSEEDWGVSAWKEIVLPELPGEIK